MKTPYSKLMIFLWAGIILLVAGQPNLFAQYDTGSLVGVIQDSTGAVLPGATVTVTNQATGAVYTTTSGSAGEYEVPSLHTGVYKITAEHTGFSTAVADNITLSVGARERIDLSLKVGDTATTIEVSDVSLELQTETSENGETVTNYRRQIVASIPAATYDTDRLASTGWRHNDNPQVGDPVALTRDDAHGGVC